MGVTKKHRKAIQGLVIATLFWGVSFPTTRALSKIQDQLLQGMSSWTFTGIVVAIRFAVSALMVAILDFKQVARATRLEWSQGLALGLFGAVGMLLQMDGLYYTEASTSAFLTQSYCIWIPVFFVLKSRQWPSRQLALSTFLVIFGISIISKLDWAHLRFGRGEWETILASVFFAGQILWLERPQYTNNKTGPVTFAMFVVMTLSSLPLALSGYGMHLENWTVLLKREPLSLLLVLTVLCTFVPYLLMNYCQKFVKAAEAGLIYCSEPIFAAIFASFLPELYSRLHKIHYLNERLTLRLIVGGLLITSANAFLQYSKHRERKRTEAL